MIECCESCDKFYLIRVHYFKVQYLLTLPILKFSYKIASASEQII